MTTNAYGEDKPHTYRVGPHRSAMHSADPLATAGGWYDVTVTASGDASWSQRFLGCPASPGDAPGTPARAQRDDPPEPPA